MSSTSLPNSMRLRLLPAGGLVSVAPPQQGTGAEGGELARARAIAQRLGITNLTDDAFDIPTYMRRQQEREV